MSEIFSAWGPFEQGLSISERGRRVIWLTHACQKTYDARHIAPLLGSPSDADRMAKALQALNALPSRSAREVRATYGKKAKVAA